MEETVVLIKPDVVQNHRVGSIIQKLEDQGFTLIAARVVHPTLDVAKRHYVEHRTKDFFEPLCAFLSSGPLVATVWSGDGIIKAVRLMIPSIREEFGTDFRRNAIHASDSVHSSARERTIWF
jgi:nucleoside-diphosphate kinase